MNNFYFNGYYSNEMGLIVEEKSIYNGPQPDFELISVPGRDGDIILDHNRYKKRGSVVYRFLHRDKRKSRRQVSAGSLQGMRRSERFFCRIVQKICRLADARQGFLVQWCNMAEKDPFPRVH